MPRPIVIEAAPDHELQPFWFEDPLRHAMAMREVAESVTLTADDGQEYSGLYVNRDFSGSGKPAIVSPNAFMEASNTPDQKYRAYQYAAANPEHPVVLIDLPSHGRSDNLTDAQRKEMLEEHRLSGVGAAQAQAVRGLLPDIKQIVVPANSVGALVGADLARTSGELDMKPLLFVGFDMAGLEKRSSIGVAASYFIRESMRSQTHYRQNPDYHLLNDSYELRFKQELAKLEHDGGFSMPDVFRHDPSFLSMIIADSPLASDGGVAALEKALDTNPQLSAILVVGGMSGICRWRKIAPTVLHMEAGYPDRLAHDIWWGDSHGMGLPAQQPRPAAYTKARVEKLAAPAPGVKKG